MSITISTKTAPGLADRQPQYEKGQMAIFSELLNSQQGLWPQYAEINYVIRILRGDNAERYCEGCMKHQNDFIHQKKKWAPRLFHSFWIPGLL
jgi:hypothetical protein